MKHPFDIQDFFHGQKPVDGAGPPVYTMVFADPSEADPVLALMNPEKSKINVSYMYFYPYNLGKDPTYVYFGNHVGDVENSKIYFQNQKPYRLDNSQHAWSENLDWTDAKIEKEGERPVVYSAMGSHASYFEAGDHEYIPGLIDHCE